MKTKSTVDEALARLSRAIERPWDNGSLPSYEDREQPLSRFLNRWTKPTQTTGTFTGDLPGPTTFSTPTSSLATSGTPASRLVAPGTPASIPAKSGTPASGPVTSSPASPARPSTGPVPTSPGLTRSSPTPPRASIAPAAVAGTSHARAAIAKAAATPTFPTDDPDTPPPPPTDRFPALDAADLGLPSPITRFRESRHLTALDEPDADAFDDLEPNTPSARRATPQHDDTEQTWTADPDSANDHPRSRLFARIPRLAAIIAVLVGALTAGLLLLPGKPAAAPPPAIPVPAEQSARTVTVDIQGKVANPGVRALPDGSRVVDAIKAGGGALPGTNTSSLNLARRLVDGEQIHVGTPPPNSAPTTPPRTNLNTAPVHQLDALPGVGIVTAQRIVEFRTRNGSFTSVDQLRQIDGIGPTRFAKLKDLVTVN